MTFFQLSNFKATSQLPITPGSLTFQSYLPVWPFSLPTWSIALLLLLAAAAVFYWYRAQAQLISRAILATLMGLRLALLALVFLLVVRPTLVWNHTTTSAGTVYVMIDQSLSMGMADPQSTPLERLRWADALGYLPEGSLPGRPALALARIDALRQSLPALRPEVASNSSADPAAVAAFVTSLEHWRDGAAAVAKTLDADPVVKSSGGGIRGTFGVALQTMEDSIRAARSKENLRDAADESAVKWSVILTNLDAAEHELKPLADRTDSEFLQAHANDSSVAGALARVTNVSRADLLVSALTVKSGRTKLPLSQLIPKYRARLVAFSDSAQVIPIPDAAQFPDLVQQAAVPAGKATSLAAGLQAVSEQAGGSGGGGGVSSDTGASVIILSDGRQNIPGDATEPARLLAARGVRVYTLLIGSQEYSPDAAVEQPDAPEWIFKDDTVRASAKIRLDGLQNQPVRVEFLRDGQVLATKQLQANSREDLQSVDFSDKPTETKVYQYAIRIPPVPTETNTLNNEQQFRVAVKKDKLSVLVVEDAPRWEYQFLVGALERDPSLKLQTVLFTPAVIRDVAPPPEIAATTASPQNPRRDAGRLPSTKAEWEAFDIIILGDVPAERLPNAQLQLIETAVRDRGATLIVLAGQQHMPAQYADTPLANLLPVELHDNQWPLEQILMHAHSGFRPAITPEAGGAVLAQWSPDIQTSSDLWNHLPLWYWHSDRTNAKPAASVLWWIADAAGPGLAASDASQSAGIRRKALLSTLSLGLGRTLYLASDQIWRFHNIQGYNLTARFWGQVIRWAVGSDLPAGGRFVRFGANRPDYTAGDPVTITARVLREDLTPYTGLAFDVVASQLPEKSPPSASSSTPPSSPSSPLNVATASVREQPEAPGYYRATFPSLPAGTLEISLKGPEVERLLNTDPTATQKTLVLQIHPQTNLEQRDMNTNWPGMLAIAQAGRGIALPGAYADVLAESLPQLQNTLTSTEQAGFFADPKDPHTALVHMIFLIVFAGLLTTEWLLRKKAGLL